MKTGMKIVGLVLVALAMTFAGSSPAASQPQQGNQGDAYVMGGEGVASPGGFTKFYLDVGLREHIAPNVLLGVEYVNEGHPDLYDAGHRDGFAIDGWYQFMVGQKLRLELGAGPYLSMNTTWTGNPSEERNKKDIGLFAAAAAAYRLGEGFNLRAQVDEILVPGSFNTTALVLGLGKDLGGNSLVANTSNGHGYSISAMAGPCKTTRSGENYKTGFQVEIQREISDMFAASISGITEGGSGISNRKGVAGQGWLVAPKLGLLQLSTGLGPYIAQESNGNDQGTKFCGLATLCAQMDIYHGAYIVGRFNRVVSTYNADEDMFIVGVGKQL